MKIRNGFISNSSSSSFIVFKNNLDKNKIKQIKELKKESFNVGETEEFMMGYTSMDNFGIEKFLKELKIPEYEYFVVDHIGWVFQDFIKTIIKK